MLDGVSLASYLLLILTTHNQKQKREYIKSLPYCFSLNTMDFF